MIPCEEWNAIQGRRALLRQQTKLLGPRLAWLTDSTLIPNEAVDSSVEPNDVRLAAFSLAGWMLIEIIQAADDVYQELDWEQAMERFRVAPELQDSVTRAVLCPATRHAPGLFAMAEIVSVIPMVASRSGVSRDRWNEIASRSQAFGAKLAHDGTIVQVLIRNYLSRTITPTTGHGVRLLNPAWFRLDEGTGLSTVTPLADLLSAACAVVDQNETHHSTCVALQAAAPEAVNGATTMFGAIWSSFAEAANRLVFPRFDISKYPVQQQAAPDPKYVETFAQLAEQRHQEKNQTAAQPYPPSVERVLENLLAAAHNRVATCQ